MVKTIHLAMHGKYLSPALGNPDRLCLAGLHVLYRINAALIIVVSIHRRYAIRDELPAHFMIFRDTFAMRDADYDGLWQFLQYQLINQFFRFRIQRTAGFIQEQGIWSRQQGAHKGETLLLTW